MRFTLAYRPDARSGWSCALFGSPGPDGTTFESEDSDCSFSLGRRVSKLRVALGGGEIVVSEPGDGGVAVFRRVAAR